MQEHCDILSVFTTLIDWTVDYLSKPTRCLQQEELCIYVWNAVSSILNAQKVAQQVSQASNTKIRADACVTDDTSFHFLLVVINALGNMAESIHAINSITEDIDWIHAVARTIEHLGSNYRQTIVSLSPEECEILPKFTHTVLQVTNAPESSVADTAFQFWCNIADTATEERNSWWSGGIWTEVLQCVMNKACFPEDFTNWEACKLDKDEFDRFRKSTLRELCCSCMEEAGMDVVLPIESVVSNFIQHPYQSSWQAIEAALYVTSCISSLLLGQEYASARESLFSDAYSIILSDKLPALSVVRVTCATFISNTASWISSNGVDLAKSIFQWLITSYQEENQDVALSISTAINRLLVCCKEYWALSAEAHSKSFLDDHSPLLERVVMDDIILSLKPILFDSRIFLCRQKVCEGISRAVAQFPATQIVERMGSLIQQLLHRVENPQSCYDSSVSENELISSIHQDLEIIALALKFSQPSNWPCGQSSSSTVMDHPAVVLCQASMATIQQILLVYESERLVVEAICDIFSRVVQTAQRASLPLVSDMVVLLLQLFSAHLHSCCLSTLRCIIEVFRGNEQVLLSLVQVLPEIHMTVLNSLRSCVGNGHTGSTTVTTNISQNIDTDLVTVYLELVVHFSIFEPESFCTLVVSEGDAQTLQIRAIIDLCSEIMCGENVDKNLVRCSVGFFHRCIQLGLRGSSTVWDAVLQSAICIIASLLSIMSQEHIPIEMLYRGSDILMSLLQRVDNADKIVKSAIRLVRFHHF